MSLLIPPYLRLIHGGGRAELNRGQVRQETANPLLLANKSSRPPLIILKDKASLHQPMSAAEAELSLAKLLKTESFIHPGDVHSRLDCHNALKYLS
jgi:hypothetical protein